MRRVKKDGFYVPKGFTSFSEGRNLLKGMRLPRGWVYLDDVNIDAGVIL